MSYRPASKPPTTQWARHLDAVLRDRDWSRVQMFEEVGEALGYGRKSRAAFLPLLEDKEPTAKQAEVLRGLFGEPPAVTVDPAAEVHADIATALVMLAQELRASREARDAQAQEIAELRAMVSLLVERDPFARGTAAQAAPGVPGR